MAATGAGICDFGWKARDFALEGVDGRTHSLADVRGPKGRNWSFSYAIIALYVRAVYRRLVEEGNALRAIGIGTIAIMPNDTDPPTLPNMRHSRPSTASPFPM